MTWRDAHYWVGCRCAPPRAATGSGYNALRRAVRVLHRQVHHKATAGVPHGVAADAEGLVDVTIVAETQPDPEPVVAGAEQGADIVRAVEQPHRGYGAPAGVHHRVRHLAVGVIVILAPPCIFCMEDH